MHEAQLHEHHEGFISYYDTGAGVYLAYHVEHTRDSIHIISQDGRRTLGEIPTDARTVAEADTAIRRHINTEGKPYGATAGLWETGPTDEATSEEDWTETFARIDADPAIPAHYREEHETMNDPKKNATDADAEKIREEYAIRLRHATSHVIALDDFAGLETRAAEYARGMYKLDVAEAHKRAGYYRQEHGPVSPGVHGDSAEAHHATAARTAAEARDHLHGAAMIGAKERERLEAVETAAYTVEPGFVRYPEGFAAHAQAEAARRSVEFGEARVFEQGTAEVIARYRDGYPVERHPTEAELDAEVSPADRGEPSEAIHPADAGMPAAVAGGARIFNAEEYATRETFRWVETTPAQHVAAELARRQEKIRRLEAEHIAEHYDGKHWGSNRKALNAAKRRRAELKERGYTVAVDVHRALNGTHGYSLLAMPEAEVRPVNP